MPAKSRPTTRRPPAAPVRRAASSLVPRLVLGALVAAAIVAGVGVVASRGGGNDVAAPSIAHVHGLGLNPADGSLQVATHTGTFRIGDDGKVQRVGSTAQDTMGFTVVGPNRFLGSGHPDAAGFRQGKPARLGLIESTDAGATWSDRSLSGEADFHALAASQGTTYGWDAGTGRLLASTDGLRWETRSTLKLLSFAVDPARVERLVAAGADGVLASTDGGRTWLPVVGAPALVSVSWAPGGTLWGADRTGRAHQSPDAGATWQAQGGVDGQPEALLASDDILVVAAADSDDRTSIHQSVDAGRTWQLRYQNPA